MSIQKENIGWQFASQMYPVSKYSEFRNDTIAITIIIQLIDS